MIIFNQQLLERASARFLMYIPIAYQLSAMCTMTMKRVQYRNGRLTARPIIKKYEEAEAFGSLPLPLNAGKPGLLYVPPGYKPQKPAAMALMLHGAGGNAEHGLHLLLQFADAHNIILVAPASKDYSWDIIAQNSFGPDVVLLDGVMDYVLTHFSINKKRIAIGGFSDGASYALSIGLGNGDLFTHILAFSPGFYHTPEKQGNPFVFISHGTGDQVLPINPCSRRIVPQLRTQGLAVTYREFDDGHVIPPQISQNAVDWFFA